jgi:hypothetical protein
MSTHCAIGVKHPDGKITGCYVHYDGSTMEPRIQDFLHKKSTTGLYLLIAKAQTTGGLRSFYSQGFDESEPTTDFLQDGDAYLIDETNFFDDHMGTFAWYLVDYNTGEIERTDKW